jgi:hypothetical protein
VDRPEGIGEEFLDVQTETYTVAIDETFTNALYTLTYDPETVEFLGAESELEHFFYNAEDGVVTLDFAVGNETGKTVREIFLTFAAKCEDGSAELITSEMGKNLDLAISEDITVPGLDHVWGEPTWEWSDDLNSATATFVCERDESHVETVEAEVTCEETEEGYLFTATVTGPDGNEYTDTRTSEGFKIIVEDKTNGLAATSIDAEKKYAPGEVTFTVTADQACLVAVKNEDGTYTVLPCTDVEEEHTFTVTIVDADVTVVIAFKGDANLDGVVNTKDATLVKQVYLGTGAFETDEALQNLTGDATGDGKITTKDSTLIKQAYLELNTINW